MQFTSPHPAPDWLNAARASDDLALQRAPPSRAAPYRMAPRAALRPTPPRHPTSGDGLVNHEQIVLSRHLHDARHPLYTK
ncbi:jg21496 [Pararge aegeria aegeria]|uniref:Jg21496 protein n=1 Tax=Pararge aegeria aegeria TaxID=348720 RepID=A0A8S4RSH0_9NEOP|nr:jg21496 [Pararge aegeria aegeria]